MKMSLSPPKAFFPLLFIVTYTISIPVVLSINLPEFKRIHDSHSEHQGQFIVYAPPDSESDRKIINIDGNVEISVNNGPKQAKNVVVMLSGQEVTIEPSALHPVTDGGENRDDTDRGTDQKAASENTILHQVAEQNPTTVDSYDENTTRAGSQSSVTQSQVPSPPRESSDDSANATITSPSVAADPVFIETAVFTDHLPTDPASAKGISHLLGDNMLRNSVFGFDTNGVVEGWSIPSPNNYIPTDPQSSSQTPNQIILRLAMASSMASAVSQSLSGPSAYAGSSLTAGSLYVLKLDYRLHAINHPAPGSSQGSQSGPTTEAKDQPPRLMASIGTQIILNETHLAYSSSSVPESQQGTQQQKPLISNQDPAHDSEWFHLQSVPFYHKPSPSMAGDHGEARINPAIFRLWLDKMKDGRTVSDNDDNDEIGITNVEIREVLVNHHNEMTDMTGGVRNVF